MDRHYLYRKRRIAMAFDDIFVRGETGKRTNQIKPDYPKTFSCYTTGSNGGILEVYLVDVSKDWMPDCSWMEYEPESDAEIS